MKLRNLKKQNKELLERNEQLQIQLAGCGVAALGWTKPGEIKPGDWAYSASLQDVLNLRAEVESLRMQVGK